MDDLAGDAESLRRELVDRLGARPGSVRLARVPYRVCPLGAHVDHQLGVATTMAIDHGVTFAYASTPNPEVRLESRDFPGAVQFTIAPPPTRRANDWGDFARGAAAVLHAVEPLSRGLVGLFAGRLQGGISSSAAAGVAALMGLQDVNDRSATPAENVEYGRRIENDFLGLRNGILDQAAVVFSRRDHLTSIDCRTGDHRAIPAPVDLPPFRVLLAFSGIRSALVGTAYNQRVAECAEAASDLLRLAGRPHLPPVLGNVAAAEFRAFRHRLRPEPTRRADHFFSEVDRVRRGVVAWTAGDLVQFGELMTASGESSIRQYECGTPPLIDLYQILVETEGVYGARFSGAGFRGCCVALVDADAAPAVARRVAAAYAARHPDLATHAPVILCDTADGASFARTADRRDPGPASAVVPLAGVP